MTEPYRELDESYEHLEDEDDHVREQPGITERLLLEDGSLDVSRRLPYLLVLTCGGAG